ncbi:hypothetical protein [Carnobacterium antarcticum]|uniref:Uncharacterized protein n=1 Tax=Carnobacterium antarcticum TaxID=2126436 RepID=A0ABW4NLE3_9LACT|nr:hypothetical protein [Carnobacterium sp. CP1]
MKLVLLIGNAAVGKMTVGQLNQLLKYLVNTMDKPLKDFEKFFKMNTLRQKITG